MGKVNVGSYGFVLALLYLLLTLTSLFQISRIIYYRHNPYSYQFAFLLMTLLWGVLRSVFWFLTPWSEFDELLLQGSGLLVQFITFTFLGLFYAQIVHKALNNWVETRKKAIIAYVIVNFLFSAGFSVTYGLAYKLDKDNMEKLKDGHAFFIAAMYLILSLFLAVYGSKLFQLASNSRVKFPFLKSKLRISLVTASLFIVFTSRAIRDFLSGLKIGDIIIDDNMDIATQVTLFLLMFFWEIIPAVLVISLFWKIPITAKPPPAPIYSALNVQDSPQNQSALFQNPARYDSDDSENKGIENNDHYTDGGSSFTPPLKVPSFLSGQTTFQTYSTKSQFQAESPAESYHYLDS